jgi:hypothetical protein
MFIARTATSRSSELVCRVRCCIFCFFTSAGESAAVCAVSSPRRSAFDGALTIRLAGCVDWRKQSTQNLDGCQGLFLIASIGTCGQHGLKQLRPVVQGDVAMPASAQPTRSEASWQRRSQ